MGRRAIKVIRKAQVPVPIYFHARNSWLFYFLSNQWDITKENYHQDFSQTSRHKS
jgi:hypothetical protein